MNSYVKHGRPCGDDEERVCSRGDSIHRFDSHALRPENLKWPSFLARLSSCTGASNPFRIGRCDDDTQVSAKEGECEALVSISAPVDWLECDSSSVRERTVFSFTRRKGE